MKLSGKIDLIIILVSLAAVLLVMSFTSSAGETAVITCGSEEMSVNFRELTQETHYTFETGGGIVVIAANSTGVWFESSPCSDKICVNTGKISNAGECAVCVPCGVSIYIEGKKSTDGMTG